MQRKGIVTQFRLGQVVAKPGILMLCQEVNCWRR